MGFKSQYNMKIFLTGHKGYVGNVLSKMLLEENFDVVGCDLEYFPQNFIENDVSNVRTIRKDIRNLTRDDLKDCSAVIHLAALSNDPMGEMNPTLTNDINFLATVKLAEIAKEAGANRFVFSSSAELPRLFATGEFCGLLIFIALVLAIVKISFSFASLARNSESKSKIFVGVFFMSCMS